MRTKCLISGPVSLALEASFFPSLGAPLRSFFSCSFPSPFPSCFLSCFFSFFGSGIASCLGASFLGASFLVSFTSLISSFLAMFSSCGFSPGFIRRSPHIGQPLYICIAFIFYVANVNCVLNRNCYFTLNPMVELWKYVQNNPGDRYQE